MRKISILILISFFAVISYAQQKTLNDHPYYVPERNVQAPSKVVTHKLGSMMLYKHLQDPAYAHSNQLKPIMVKGEPSAIRALVAQYGGQYKYSAGKISSVAIPYKNIMAFSQSEAVERMESGDGFGRLHNLMDSARIRNNIDSAHMGAAPLIQPYTGSGVLVGIIDGGIYFRHQDFRRLNGNTRIKYIWDQADTTEHNVYSPSPYGSAWDSTAINAGLCHHIESSSDQGHGTCVAGVAAGNGLSWNTGDAYLKNRYVGVAPDADIAVVSIDNSRPDYLAAVADAVNYIFTKADELGVPCVINTSIGTYYGPHDGSELSVQAIDNMLDAKKGRVLVAAAGNGASIKHHLSYQLSSTDSLWTWFLYNSNLPGVYFDFWADTAQFQNANFALGCDVNTGAYRGRTRYFNVPVDFHPAPNTTVAFDDTLFDATHTVLGLYEIDVTAYDGLYHVMFSVWNVNSTTNLWRLETKGQGIFDCWASKSLMGTSSFATLNNPLIWPNYRFPDSVKTIVSGWQCSDKVIDVANYNNRAGYFDKDSNYVNLTIAPYYTTVGALSSSSSIGPTRDGRIKPDIGATGDITTCTGDSTYISQLIGASQGYKVSLGTKQVRNGGTSMASPIVAGCACLYLQEHPNASYDEVKQVIERTATIDTFTSSAVPNTRFGAGKINCYQALLYHVVYGCKDTGSINYNAAANIDTGGCIAKKYGITDSLCVNYDSTANVNNGTCQPLGVKETSAGSIGLDVVPNPFGNVTMIYIYAQTPLPDAEIRFYDVLGKTVDVINLPAGTKQISYINSKLAAGVYHLAIVRNNGIIAIKKVVVE